MAAPGTLVVTGASAGIGRAVAERFLDAGWNVALLARRRAVLDEVAAGRASALALACDVADASAVEAAFEETARHFGRIDVLFNNAGIFPKAGLIDEVALTDWQAIVDVNLNGMVYAARAAFGQMRRQRPQGGRIINNGSISAHAPRPGSLGYTVTKHAITGLTKVLALDGRPFDIACGQIDIGNAETELASALGQGAKQADGRVQPEPLMDVAHVADAVYGMATLPLTANVLNLTIMATKMPFVGRG
ncbi:SDR family NAD(P)-dependent oxidoreductase [Frigidibacter sp. RF13]|uniref:SDR family oxidoreductase n=1 Tax=Frigidibacter sp. RF13 TaxID=2997340 RepID=UPI002270C631|nr:SDR family oxidoreductase [Frigidibacter sp. RF13]MCY1126196.1 SDR family NAD(P)-dependent oxidoreductase [Frigidibacter sp. RF13]